MKRKHAVAYAAKRFVVANPFQFGEDRLLQEFEREQKCKVSRHYYDAINLNTPLTPEQTRAVLRQTGDDIESILWTNPDKQIIKYDISEVRRLYDEDNRNERQSWNF